MKFFFVTLLIILNNAAYSQTYSVEYESREQDQTVEITEIFNDTISILKLNINEILQTKYDVLFIKNKLNNICYYKENFMNVAFYVSDTLNNFKWELMEDSMFILDKKCLSAKTSFRGRTYIAYYSPQYTNSDGPWKFCGLPGLILYVKSIDNYLEYKAVKIIENCTKEIENYDYSRYKFSTWNEFVDDYKKTITKYFKTLRSNGTIKEGNTITIKLPSRELFFPELQTENGLTN
jgi:hypothetical protein